METLFVATFEARFFVALSLVATLLLLGACSPPDLAVVQRNSVVCSGYIDQLNEPPPSWHPVLGAVAFPIDPVETGRAGAQGTPYEGLRFAKFGLLVRTNTSVVLEVPKTGDVLMEWTLAELGRPANVLRIGPCEGGGADWIVFAGGLWVAEPMCVVIAVTSGGQAEEAQVGVDHHCS